MPAKDGMSTTADHAEGPRATKHKGWAEAKRRAATITPGRKIARHSANLPAVPLPAPFSLSATKRRVSLSHSPVLLHPLKVRN